MAQPPLVSVVVSFLDAGRFLRHAAASVFAQTYPGWELLLIDDGSSDESTETALRLAERHPGTVRYFEHEDHANRGPGASRNVGLRAAKGEYIAVLDADDVWLPRKLERQMAVLEREPRASVVYGPSLYWFSWRDHPERRDFVPALGLGLDRLYTPPSLLTLCYPLGPARTPCPSDLLFRREILERTGGFEESFCGHRALYDDVGFLVKVHLKETVFVTSECLGKYRQHGDSIVSRVTRAGQYMAVRRYFLEWFTCYLAAEGVDDPAVLAALTRARRPLDHPRLHRGAVAFRRLVDRVRDVRQREPVATPAVGRVPFGDLRRVTPLRRRKGTGLGQLERHLVDGFVDRHAANVRGSVVRISEAVTLAALPARRHDAVVLPHVLHRVWELDDALRALRACLRPSGVLLVTVPGVVAAGDGDDDYWRFTTRSLRALLERHFSPTAVTVEAFGNVLASVGALHGLAPRDLPRRALSHPDGLYPLVIGARAVADNAQCA